MSMLTPVTIVEGLASQAIKSGAVKSLLPILFNAGAPMIANQLKTALGDKNVAVVGTILNGLGGLLGVDPDPDVLSDHIENNPSAAQAVSSADAGVMQHYAELGQAQLKGTYDQWARDSASDDKVQRWWRPMGAYEFYAECFMLMATVCYLMIHDFSAFAHFVADGGWIILAVLTAYWAIRGGLLGVYIIQRSQEKQADMVANAPIAGNLDVLGNVLKTLAPAAARR